MNKRVLMLTHQCAWRGGSFMRAVSLARALAGMGYDMTLVASRARAGLGVRRAEWQGVRVVEMPDVFPWSIRNGGLSLLDLAGRLVYSRRGFDLFHTFDQRPCASLPALWRADRHVPWVSDWADLWGPDGLGAYRTSPVQRVLAKLDAAMEPYIRSQCDAVTAISTKLRDQTLRLGVPPECVRLVPAGANPDLIRPGDKLAARAHFGLPAEAEILMCSGFTALDAPFLADCFLELRKMRPGVRLVMTGGHIAPLEHALRAAGAAQDVIHLGMLPYEQLGDALACADIKWLPFSELPVDAYRFPNRFGEAIAAGLPIATNFGGDHARIVEEQGIGVVTHTDPVESAQAIAALLDDPGRRAAMGRKARELAVSTFAWSTIARGVAELYEQLL